jgi:hypothetical protein
VGLDIRLPIGSMFLFVGVLLTVYGAVRPQSSESVGININLTWGVVLLVFGIVMILLGRRGTHRLRNAPAASDASQLRGGH